MTKHNILPERYHGATLSSAEPEKPKQQVYCLDWERQYQERKRAAKRADTELFPLSRVGEFNLEQKKKKHPEFFQSVRQENLFRLFEYYRERFAIFEQDCKEFQEFWYDMELGGDLWKWAERIDGGSDMFRFHDFEAMTALLVHPMEQAREQAKAMREGMELYFKAINAFINMGRSHAEMVDEYERRRG